MPRTVFSSTNACTASQLRTAHTTGPHACLARAAVMGAGDGGESAADLLVALPCR
jgi:hypothetical protein